MKLIIIIITPHFHGGCSQTSSTRSQYCSISSIIRFTDVGQPHHYHFPKQLFRKKTVVRAVGTITAIAAIATTLFSNLTCDIQNVQLTLACYITHISSSLLPRDKHFIILFILVLADVRLDRPCS